jgi:hypothetical protein
MSTPTISRPVFRPEGVNGCPPGKVVGPDLADLDREPTPGVAGVEAGAFEGVCGRAARHVELLVRRPRHGQPAMRTAWDRMGPRCWAW